MNLKTIFFVDAQILQEIWEKTFLEQGCFILNIHFFHTDFCKNYCFFINQTILFNKDLTMNKQFY